MSKLFLAAGVAALAISTPSMAQKHGNGNGGGHGNGGAEHGQMQAHGGGQDKGHGGPPGQMKGNAPHGGMAMAAPSQGKLHGNGNGGNAKMAGPKASMAKGNMKADRAMPTDVRHADAIDGRLFPRLASNDGRGLVTGCPPGLAMKGNGCMPPGQAKKIGDTWANALSAQALAGPYSQWYRDSDQYVYRMGDGVLYQVNRSNGLIDALIPYGMRDYSYYPVGYTYPDLYNSYNVPTAYRSYYPNGGDMLYRYGGNAIYAVNPQTNLVSSIVSLLAGDLAVGQPLPSDYGVYNVPLSYRSQYADTANDWYRYNDGYIYRVDPTTQLVTAVINALV